MPLQTGNATFLPHKILSDYNSTPPAPQDDDMLGNANRQIWSSIIRSFPSEQRGETK